MRGVLHVLLLAVAFGLELWVLSVCAVAAYRWPDDLVLRVAAAALAPLLMGLLWGHFTAPRARRRLAGISSVAFRLAWFGVGVLATAWILGSAAGFVFASVWLVDACGLRLSGRGRVER